MWLAASPCSIADTSDNMLAPWMATPTALSSRKSSARFLVDPSQEDVETPGGHEEEEPCRQRDDETQAERRPHS